MQHNVQPTKSARDEQDAAADRSFADQFPTVAAFLAEERAAAQPDEFLRRARGADEYARTRTIRLLDFPGATLAVTCPDWCESDHYEDKTHGTFLEDFAHRGAEEALHAGLDGGSHEDVLLCEITQYPFDRDMRQPVVMMRPSLGMNEAELGPDQLRALADQLREYAAALDKQVKRLESAREQAARGRRADHEGRWTR